MYLLHTWGHCCHQKAEEPWSKYHKSDICDTTRSNDLTCPLNEHDDDGCVQDETQKRSNLLTEQTHEFTFALCLFAQCY